MDQMHRLNALSIVDDLARAELYRWVRDNQGNQTWAEFYTSDAFKLKPEAFTYKIYGVDYEAVKWLIFIACGVDDMKEEIPAGMKISLPSAIGLRLKIREIKQHYGEL